jgi:hypothetical protein
VEAIAARTAVANETRIPFTHLAAIEFRAATPAEGAERLFQAAIAERAAGHDVLITGGAEPAKSLRGTLTEIGPEDAEFIYNDRPRRLGTDRVHAIVFATGAAQGKSGNVVAQLADGRPLHGDRGAGGDLPAGSDRVTGTLIDATPDLLRLVADFGQPIEIPIAALQTLEFRNDRVVYLSDLTPVSQTVTGLVHEPWPFRNDRNVFNQPLTLDGRQYEKGLGVHARSELTYALDGQYAAFAATIGIDDAARPAGDVEFRILVDGQEAYTSGPITGRDQARAIHVSLTNANQITLLVDFGGNADIADWAIWAEARLIKPKPSG